MRNSEGLLLGMKAISWSERDHKFVSPLQTGFHWDKSGWAEAGCVIMGIQPGVEDKEHLIPYAGCSCGIYATTSMHILKGYIRDERHLVAIVAACGRTEVWSAGFRSQAALIVGVMRDLSDVGRIGDKEMVRMLAHEYFDTLSEDDMLIPHQVVQAMIRQSWKEEGYG